YRCALTGAQFGPPRLHLHPDLDVAVIKPREQGGPLSIANCLPMLTSLKQAFVGGLIAVEDNFRIVVPHPALLERNMLTSLRTSLVVPDDPLLRPGEFLEHHRRYALGRYPPFRLSLIIRSTACRAGRMMSAGTVTSSLIVCRLHSTFS